MSKPTMLKSEPLDSRQRWACRLDTAAWFAILLVVGMRPLLSETYYSALDPIVRTTQSAGDSTPATTAWLDLAIWTAGIAAAGAAWLGKRRWRLTGIELGFAVLAAAAIISAVVANDKRLAINASFSWLTALGLVTIVGNLARDRLRLALLLAVLVASGLASVARSSIEKWDDATQEYYQANKASFWAQQNVRLDDPRVELYERRLYAGEVSGFFPMSNNQAAWLGLAGFALLGLRGLLSRHRGAAWAMLVPAALVFGMVVFTGSKGGMVAIAGGLILWAVLSRVHERLRPHWFAWLIGVWVGLAVVVSAVAAYGIATGGLPTDSMRFRWNYWQVSSDIIAQNWATGVGALNFDDAYLQVKPVEFPEEIRDPHNFAISIVAQWGVLGGLGLLMVLAGGSYALARRWGRRENESAPAAVTETDAANVGFKWAVALSVGFVLLRLLLMRGWLGTAEGNAFVFFDLGLYGLVWIVTCVGLIWMTHRWMDADTGPAQVACLVGVLVFLVHNTIDSAMFFPGTLIPFAAMVGALLAAHKHDAHGQPASVPQPSATRASAISCLIYATGTLALLALVVVPVTRANRLLLQARFRATSLENHMALLERAAEADPLDATAPAEIAMTLTSASNDSWDKALAAINEATGRVPQRASLYRLKAGLLELSSQKSGSMSDLLAALGAAAKAVDLYPNSSEDHEWIADMIVRTGVADGSGYWALKAVDHYRTALELDGLRFPGEIRKWRPERREAIEARIGELLARSAHEDESS